MSRIKKMMEKTVASYSLLIMHQDRIWAVRDPYGNRPLCIGKLLPTDAVTGKHKLLVGMWGMQKILLR